jgi:hypothetical protein
MAIGLFSILIIIVCFGIVLLPFILYLSALQKLIKLTDVENRYLSPGSVWLWFIPIVGTFIHIGTINKLCNTLELDFNKKGIKFSESQIGRSAGMTFSIINGVYLVYTLFSSLYFNPYFNSDYYYMQSPMNTPVLQLVSFAAVITLIVCWIVFWVKVAGNIKVLRNPSLIQGNSQVNQTYVNKQAPIINKMDSKCPQCSTVVNENYKFCTKCGLNIDEYKKEIFNKNQIHCPECNEVQSSENASCTKCSFPFRVEEKVNVVDESAIKSAIVEEPKIINKPTPPKPTIIENKEPFWDRNKNLIYVLITLLVITVSCFFIFKADPQEEAKELADLTCECMKVNDDSYVDSLINIDENFSINGFEYKDQVNKRLSRLSVNHKNFMQSGELLPCKKELNPLFYSAKSDWSRNSSSGKLFWDTYDKIIEEYESKNNISNRVEELLITINDKVMDIDFENYNQFLYHKNDVINFMSNYYSSITNSSFDAYNWYSYYVKRYINRSNITPTDINLLYQQESDAVNKEVRLIDETFKFVGKENSDETWNFSIEYKCYKPSMQKYQICNVKIEVILNDDQKIKSYREVKVENLKYIEGDYYQEEGGEPDYSEQMNL